MKLFIPTIGDKLILSQDWTFSLYHERRNKEFMKRLGYVYVPNIKHLPCVITLLKGTPLIVKRIYIRSGAGSRAYDSLSFYIKKEVGSKVFGRFWVKLSDVNNIEFEKSENVPEEDFSVFTKPIPFKIINNYYQTQDGLLFDLD